MSTVNYNIDHFKLKPNFRFNIVSIVYSIVIPLRIKWLIKVFTLGVNKRLTGQLKRSKSLANESEKLDKDSAIQLYPTIKGILFNYREMMAMLEKDDFFSNLTTKRLSESVLDNLYKAELTTRLIAYDDNQTKRDDEKELVEFASRVSLRSLQDH